jgi:hypothetical protein
MRASGTRVLLAALVALAGVPGAHTLFGLRGSGGSQPAAAGAAGGGAGNATSGAAAAQPPAVAADKPGQVRQADPADPYPVPPTLDDLQDYEAWEDGKGELHIIRAVRAPSGEFSFPEGTTVRRACPLARPRTTAGALQHAACRACRPVVRGSPGSLEGRSSTDGGCRPAQVPKDPRSMARIVAVTNAMGEHFQCLIPALKRVLDPTWLDVPQVPVVEALDSRRAEEALRSLEGKCFYRVAGVWTYEFCYKSHVKQMRIDPNGNRLLEEILLGVYNESMPFELLTAPDRLDHTQHLDQDGPAWTTSVMTVYGSGDGADQYGNGWMSLKGSLNPFSKNFGRVELSSVRPRQVGLKFKCLKIEEPGFRQWLEDSHVYLDKDHVPFDVHVHETALGVYEMTVPLPPPPGRARVSLAARRAVPVRILQNTTSCGLSVPRCHEFPSVTA